MSWRRWDPDVVRGARNARYDKRHKREQYNRGVGPSLKNHPPPILLLDADVAMSADTPLSNLCSVCNASTSKYRCPGCSTRTCSLPCYKRHKQWGHCSGRRDPTKFVKKSKLATPAGIDHDFNFLTGIERSLAKAEDTIEKVVGPAAKSTKHHPQGAIQYQRLVAAGVQVLRAPKGLSRQRENQSHVGRNNRRRANKGTTIVWTVEWIGQDKQRALTQTSSVSVISEVQPLFKSKTKAKAEQKARLKVLGSNNTANNQRHPLPVLFNSTPVGNDGPSVPHQDHAVPVLDLLSHQPEQRREHPPNDGGAPQQIQENEAAHPPDDVDMEAAVLRHDCGHGPGTESLGREQHRFYLLKPRTSSPRTVLIPLDPNATLGDCLVGRTVLEFPTIYCFAAEAGNELPKEFILEEDYVKQEGKQQEEYHDLVKEVDPEIMKHLSVDGPAESQAGGEVNSDKIRDVLMQDVGIQR